jgi:hypothetical protein
MTHGSCRWLLERAARVTYSALKRLVFEHGRTALLGYCDNVLPGETVDALIDQVRRICGPIRTRLGVERIGVGIGSPVPMCVGQRSVLLPGTKGEVRR